MEKKESIEALQQRINELENALANAHSLHCTILDNLPYVAWLKGKDLKFLHVNQLYLDAIKKEEKDIIGKSDFDIFPKELATKYRQDDDKLISSKHELHAHDERDGVVFSSIKIPVFDKNGEFQFIIGYGRNVVKESDLELDRDFLNALMDNIPDTIYFKDLQSRFTRINKAKAREIGLNHEDEALGKTDYDFFDDDRPHVKFEDEKHIIETGQSLINKIEFIHDHTGREFWISTTKTAIRDKDGNIIGTVGISRDITEQKEALQKVSLEREFLQVLMDYIPHTIYFKDRQSRFTKINKAQAQLTGLKHPDDAVGKTDFDLFPGEHSRMAFADEQKLMEIGIPMVDKVEKVTGANGEIRWVTATKYPVKDANGNVTGMVGMSINITEKYIYEQKLKEAKERAEESDRLKTAFLANMSHEIRTPMNGIIGFSNLLKDENLTAEERVEFITHINNCGNSLLTLIDDIIDISKIEAGQIKIKLTETNINEIIHGLLDSFQTIKASEGKDNIELKIRLDLADEKSSIYTDSHRLQQIMSNLIGNALKFTCEGSIEFGYLVEDNENIKFFIKDTGIGIPKDKQKVIFERFGQVIDPRITNKKGTGLGLAISGNLTKLLGGKIWVESEENEGSTFFFTLPYKQVENPHLNKEKDDFDIKTLDLKGKTILIAEDEDTNFFYYKELFKESGVKLLWVKNGFDAVHSYKFNQDVCIILMDIQMPEMDGFAAVTEIKKLNSHIPIIAQTAFAMADEREKCLESGFDAYISKPVLKEELFKTIGKLLVKK